MSASWLEQFLRDCAYTKITVVVELADVPPTLPQSVTIESGPGRAQIGINRVVEERSPLWEGGDITVPGMVMPVFSQPVLSVAAKPFYRLQSMITITPGEPDGQGPVRPADPAQA